MEGGEICVKWDEVGFVLSCRRWCLCEVGGGVVV